MSYTSNARSFVASANNADRIRSFEAQVKSGEHWLKYKSDELRSAPAYKRECILENIARSEKSLNETKAALARLRGGC